MTIDEYLQREMERGNFLQGGTEPKKKSGDELDGNEFLQEEEVLKQRHWDDYKDGKSSCAI